MSLIIKPELHQQFKEAVAAEGEKMTAVIVRFIKDYVKKHRPQDLGKNNKTGGRK